MNPESVIALLKGVESTGHNRGMALCPAHPDKTPSLSWQINEEGHLLLHCFAGCDIFEVLRPLGLTVADLFADDNSARKHVRSKKPHFTSRELWMALSHECVVVLFIASDFYSERALTETEWERLNLAVGRIAEARMLAYGK